LEVSEDEWVLLVKTLGRIKGIKELSFSCQAGSRAFHPFQAVAEAVKRQEFEKEVEAIGPPTSSWN
jgi:hypothetical protein